MAHPVFSCGMWQAKWLGSRASGAVCLGRADGVYEGLERLGRIYVWCTPVSNYVDAMSLPRPTRQRGLTIPLSGLDREPYAPSPSPGLPASSTHSHSLSNPPRPSYLASTRNRLSWSAADTLLEVPPFDSQRAPSPTLYGRAHSSASKYAPLESDTPPATAAVAVGQIYTAPYLRSNVTPPPDAATLQRPSRVPPSAFHFPSQVYTGNTDPSLPTPGLGYRSGRSSTESLHGAYSSAIPAPSRRSAQALSSQHGNMFRASQERGSWVEHDLEPPYPPFMAQTNGSQPPNNSSTIPIRAPFLSPASRPSSMIWWPPSNANHSHTALTTVPSSAGSEIPPKAPLPSTLLSEKLTQEDKPWLIEAPDGRTRAGRWISLLMILLGACGAGLLCWTGYQDAGRTIIDPKQLCLVMEDTFDNLDVDNGGTWTRDVEMSGFGCVSYMFT